ncbi:hypothetical protein [Marinilactibacillus psychrotolerans]|uniref:hypothetical protein n=1 Tax=Marinilactibacillus psychrotolerans TaxID=191770 RepID=UPI0039B0CED5
MLKILRPVYSVSKMNLLEKLILWLVTIKVVLKRNPVTLQPTSENKTFGKPLRYIIIPKYKYS